jgi:predicted HicB family RNase H-like nuclease
MKDVLRFGDLVGSVHFSAEDECFFGRLEGVDDLVTFEGRDVDELKRAFREAVEDYARLCREAGKPLQKSYRGSFNVRITAELHQKAAQKSALLGISLNQLVQRAVEREVRENQVQESPRRYRK